MKTKKQTKAQELLSNVKLTGQTSSGGAQNLDTEVKVQSPKLNIEAEQEYILINKLSETGIEIKARFITQEIPTDKEKFLFMLGEACYAAMFEFHEAKSEEIKTSEQKKSLFDSFMQELTETVKIYHQLNSK